MEENAAVSNRYKNFIRFIQIELRCMDLQQSIWELSSSFLFWRSRLTRSTL
jgi:hypothetical protein